MTTTIETPKLNPTAQRIVDGIDDERTRGLAGWVVAEAQSLIKRRLSTMCGGPRDADGNHREPTDEEVRRVLNAVGAQWTR